MKRLTVAGTLSATTLVGGAMALAAAAAGCAGGGRKPSQTAAPIGCAPANPEPCEAACFKGDGKACAIYGVAVEGIPETPVRLKKNLARSRGALEHGCRLANLDACCDLQGYQYDHTPDKHGACYGLLSLCDRGHLRSCSYSANCLIYEPGFPHDVERAIGLLEASCAKGEPIGCRELAALAERGVYVDADPARAFTLMKKACDGDDPLACAHAGRFYEHGIGTKVDLEAARKLYRAACARGIKQLPCEALERLGETPPALVER